MPISNAEQQRRLILSKLMVELIHPSATEVGTGMVDRLVVYCVGAGGTQRLHLNKIAELAGLPRNTTRAALNRLINKGWVTRCPDGGFVIDAAFKDSPQRQIDLNAKYRQILLAAEALRAVESEQISQKEGSVAAHDGARQLPAIGAQNSRTKSAE